jgi:Flp pilus assembly protein TadD
MVGCAFGESGATSTPIDIVPGPTLTGNYLAARHARTQGDESAAATFLLAALARSPDDPMLLSRTLSVLILDGRVGEAVEIAKRTIAVQPEMTLAHLTLAVEDLRLERYGAATARLESLTQNNENLFVAPLLLAWARAAEGDADRALAGIQPPSSNPQLALLQNLHAAWISEKAGRGEAAERFLRQALEKQKEPWLRLVELAGASFERLGRPEDARALYAEYLSRHPESRLLTDALDRLSSGRLPPPDIPSGKLGAAESLFDGAGILGRQNSRDMSLALARLGLHLRPDFPALQVVTGDLLDSFERFEAANEVYAAVNPASALSWPARLNIARNLEGLDRFEEARVLLRELAKERPADTEALSELGDMLRKNELYAEAVSVYDEAFGRIPVPLPQHWRLLYARGIALERIKEWPRAEADFLKALEFEPDQPFVLNYLGYSWVEQGRNLGQAEAMIRKAVDLRPNDGYIVDSLGWVLFRLGQYEEAVGHLERAVELRPEDPVINDHLGDAYWSVGRQREARFQWRAALDLKPEPDLRAQIEQKLERGLVTEANAHPQ